MQQYMLGLYVITYVQSLILFIMLNYFRKQLFYHKLKIILYFSLIFSSVIILLLTNHQYLIPEHRDISFFGKQHYLFGYGSF